MIKLMLLVCCLAVSEALFGQKSEFSWLVGTWQGAENSFEVWTTEGNSLLGSVYQIDRFSGKRIVTEEIRLIKKGKDFFYVPDVSGPQGPVEFRISSFGGNNFTAENPDHDFPKKITYKRTGEMLEAAIAGGSKSVNFVFKKIK